MGTPHFVARRGRSAGNPMLGTHVKVRAEPSTLGVRCKLQALSVRTGGHCRTLVGVGTWRMIVGGGTTHTCGVAALSETDHCLR